MDRLQRPLLIAWILFALAGCASMGPEHTTLPVSEALSQEPRAVAITQISPRLLKEELDLFKRELLAIHPDPFARIDQAEFEHEFERIKASLNYPLSRAEFFLQLAPLLASLRDVHTYLSLPKDEFGDVSLRGERLFPLAVIIHKERLLVASDLSQSPQIPTGAEIVEINNAPTDYLLKVMRSLTARETITGQDRRIQLDFSWLLSAMGYANQEYQVVYRWQGQNHRIDIAGLEVVKPLKSSANPISYYGFSKITPRTSLLWLNDFNEKPEVFSDFLDDKFGQMADYQVENLIIDVRYNQGGLSENLKNLLSRLTSEPVFWANKGVIKVSEKLKNNHFSKTKQRREDKYSWGLQWLPLEWTDKLQHSIWWADLGETITLSLDSIKPHEDYIPRRVWVLTNGFCYSACSLFVASVNHYQLAKTMGEKAGSLAGEQFVYPVQVKLPHSGLTLSLPTMLLEFSPGKDVSLIEPQVQIHRTIDDISQRMDPVLNKALSEAEQGKGSKLGKN